MVTTRSGIVLGILTADCAPILFADPENRVIAAAHAGWKIDLSRRQGDIRQQELKRPLPEDAPKSFFEKLFAAETPANDS